MGLDEYGAQKISARPLEFIWLVDVSGSMYGEKIESLNHAIRDVIPEMKKVAGENINAEVFMRAIKFSDTASWHIGQRTPLDNFTWVDLKANGLTSMGQAMKLLANALDKTNMPSRGLPPILVLLSDGAPTDDFNSGLRELLSKPWAKKAVKIAIAIGNYPELSVLEKFIDNSEIKPLVAKNATQLTAYIKWASTQVLSATSQSTSTRENVGKILIPNPPTSIVVSDDEVW